MNRRLVAGRGLVAMAAALLLGGCIRESLPPCPPLVIELSVKDKNYFNIDDAVRLGLLERRAEDLPFRDYVHSLYYIVRDEQGEVVAEQHNTPVTDDSQVQRIVLPASLPYGTYTVTAWGNMQSEEPLGEDATQAEMEAAGAAANDIYLASATLEYRYGRDLFSVGIERTKGNLLIKAENLPDMVIPQPEPIQTGEQLEISDIPDEEGEEPEAQPYVYTPRPLIYNGPTDKFIDTLATEEKIEFCKAFIDKTKGDLPTDMPEYELGGNNEQFFLAIFLNLGKFRQLLSAKLLRKIYRYLNDK